MALPYSSPVRGGTREAVIKVHTEESGLWQTVKTAEVTSEDYEHVCTHALVLDSW